MRDTFQLAKDFLDLTITELTNLGVNVPSVQYVAPGSEIAYDTSQITSNIVRIFPGAAGEENFSALQFIVMMIELQIVLIRNTPTIEDAANGGVIIPNAKAIQASAQEALNDATQLTQALVNIAIGGKLVSLGATPVTPGPVTTQGPEGGVVATIGSFTMPLL